MAGLARTGAARTLRAKALRVKTLRVKQNVTERDIGNRFLRLLSIIKPLKCPLMITNFANSFALTHFDIMSKLIWACKSVRLISRKKPKA
ncbi:hypothetical protein ASTA108788_06710 [Asticcacaulis taihuensis]